MLAQGAASAALQDRTVDALTAALTTAMATVTVGGAPAAARSPRPANDMSAKERTASETAPRGRETAGQKATSYWFTNKRCTIVAALRACAADARAWRVRRGGIRSHDKTDSESDLQCPTASRRTPANGSPVWCAPGRHASHRHRRQRGLGRERGGGDRGEHGGGKERPLREPPAPGEPADEQAAQAGAGADAAARVAPEPAGALQAHRGVHQCRGRVCARHYDQRGVGETRQRWQRLAKGA